MEKLLIFGIGAFGFMMLAQTIRVAYETKRLARKKNTRRIRRQVSSEIVALDIAKSLIRDVLKANEELAAEAKQTGVISPALDKELNRAKAHFVERVIPSLKGTFYTATDEVILNKKITDK